eukprot:TRINITY_DN12139_c1_g1_i4.p3 TRINITY_DN12139_c1_g1~~TRINITY_DN12139_c1_g1_i4.p3  ORF type:complete len:107 (+),score=1.23 TRINITY_DN12139_c1_g1_i4:613-933(+)
MNYNNKTVPKLSIEQLSTIYYPLFKNLWNQNIVLINRSSNQQEFFKINCTKQFKIYFHMYESENVEPILTYHPKTFQVNDQPPFPSNNPHLFKHQLKKSTTKKPMN